MDLIEIRAGGGSLAGIDERRLLRVGPRSAGAKEAASRISGLEP
jgi:N-methylhydantoinase A/oxoprolinase/acetone carboxylase beta subunit